jgi:hypothetical protein
MRGRNRKRQFCPLREPLFGSPSGGDDHAIDVALKVAERWRELLGATVGWVAQRGRRQYRGCERFNVLAGGRFEAMLAHDPGEVLEPLDGGKNVELRRLGVFFHRINRFDCSGQRIGIRSALAPHMLFKETASTLGLPQRCAHSIVVIRRDGRRGCG